MHITDLTVEGFKNIGSITMMPDADYNLIVGKNAQGKTNLLEAIWLMSGCRSFRGTKERDYIGFDRDRMQIVMHFIDARRTQYAIYELRRGGNRKLILNGVEQSGTAAFFEQFRCVVFTPDDLSLIADRPERRRSFVDLCFSQIKPSYMDYVRRYDAIISQRNAAIRTAVLQKQPPPALDVWDTQLAEVGAKISFWRNFYINRLNAACSRLYARISGGSEQLSVEYASHIYRNFTFPDRPDADMTERYYNRLCAGIADDMRVGYTLCGAGRDDMLLKINGRSVRDYGSQGQKKSTALVLKLAQAEIFQATTDDAPVILLDDVMGELDANRQQLVFEIIQNMQVFITTCNEDAIISRQNGRRVTISGGRVVGW